MSFYSVYLVKRLLFCVIIVFLYGYPFLQIAFLYVVTILFGVYMAVLRPCKNCKVGICFIVNEGFHIILITLIAMLKYGGFLLSSIVRLG